MDESTVVGLPRPGGRLEDDPLLCVLRDGARRMLMQAIEAEVAGFLAAHADHVDDHGRRRLVRNGHAPMRSIQTGIGPIEVRRPRVRDRGAGAGGAPRIRFTSAVLPAYPRRTKHVEELLPWLYLRGISTGQFEAALTVLLGPNAPGLSATTVWRLVSAWQDELSALAAPRSLDQTVRLRLGRRGLFLAASRARSPMHPGPDRCRRERQEGAPGARRRLSRERAVLARAADPPS
jgi:hypothetical protein